ncbi:MAG: oligosaccharide flippase family protein [Planctomycetales bacterium]|nr:oligosaccharide flippase family protein [Planctomycetales bacterium]
MTRSRPRQRTLLARVARNSASLLASDVLNKATTFAVYAMLSRFADPRTFGQLSLGLLLLYTFQVFACMGLPKLITRDLAGDRSQTASYFLHGNVVISASSLVATVALALFALIMRYEHDTVLVISALALGLLPYALSTVAEAIFRAWETMHCIAIANVPVNVLKVAAAFALLKAGFGVMAIALLLVACRVFIFLIEWLLLRNYLERDRVTFSLGYAKQLARRSTTFLGIDGVIAIWASVDVVLLSKLRGEAEVGLFSAAWQLLLPAKLFFQSVVTSVFPMMCQRGMADLQDLKRFVRWLIEFLVVIGMPIGIGVYFLAESGLMLMYGEERFLASADVVRVLVFVLLLHVMTSVLGHALWAGLKERLTLRIVVVNVVVNLVASYFLINAYGLIGAAYGSLLTWMVNGWQHYFACSKLFIGMPLTGAMWRGVAAGAAMVACFAMLKSDGPFLAGSAASVCYVFAIGLLMLVTHGGLQGLRQNYFAPLLK